IESGDYRYIVKRVDLKEKVYEDTEENEYYEFFEDFADTVEYEKYENYVKSFFGDITVDAVLVDSRTLQNTFLSADVDRYYQEILYYYYGISSH
ncbi:MAG: hypothetical protein IKD07_06520, partial [Clostridia bacterium]|nr:hypothetical protein [Clostridia bacterium]